MAAAFQLTSRNAIVTLTSLTSLVIPNPVVLQGWAEDNFLTIEQTQNVEMKKSLDNNTIAWVKPVTMSGKLMVLPNSIAQQALQTLQTFQTQTGVIVFCTLTVTYPSILATVVYNNFCVDNIFGGYPIGEKVGNVEIGFRAEVPGTSALNSLVALGLATIGSF